MRLLIALILLFAGAVVGAALIWPISVGVADALTADWSRAALTPRSAGLLLRGFEVAAEATALALCLGGALAAGIVCAPRPIAAALKFCGVVTILSPPYVYAYAWSLILLRSGVATSQEFAGDFHQWLALQGRAVWCLGTWTAPLAAGVLLCGWRSAGRASAALAATDARADQLLFKVMPRALAPWAGLAALIAGVVALTEFSVCHLCLVQTYNTQVMADVQLLAVPGQALLLAWPLALLAILIPTVFWPVRRLFTRFLADALSPEDVDGAAALLSRPARAIATVCGAIAISALLAPIVILIGSAGGWRPFVDTWLRYADNWPGSIAGAIGAAVAAGVVALAVEYLFQLGRGSKAYAAICRASATAIVACLLLAALLPPALVGDAAAAAWNHAPLIRDHWPALSLICFARYGIFAVGAMWLSGKTADAPAVELAAIDGASPAVLLWRVRVPRAARILGAALGTITILSLLEVAATLLVQPPGTASISQTMLNAIHFGRDAQVAAMCVYLIAAAGVGAAGLRLVAQR